MTASEARALARGTGIKAHDHVLDLCCGAGGLTCHLAEATGGEFLGVDRSPGAIRLARSDALARQTDRYAKFLIADATRLPLSGPFDAALLFETMLAVQDKATLLDEIHRVLRPRARFGLTLEEGIPLEGAGRRTVGHLRAVWLIPGETFAALAKAHGFHLVWQEDHTSQHAAVAMRLLDAYERHRMEIARLIGSAPCERLITDHRLWVRWLTNGRVRKLALVVERGT
ncbi:MAG: class I SAM-dependent methyltransferase [Chloroflexota bacterium]